MDIIRGWEGLLGVWVWQIQPIIYKIDKQKRSYYIAQGTIFNIL